MLAEPRGGNALAWRAAPVPSGGLELLGEIHRVGNGAEQLVFPERFGQDKRWGEGVEVEVFGVAGDEENLEFRVPGLELPGEVWSLAFRHDDIEEGEFAASQNFVVDGESVGWVRADVNLEAMAPEQSGDNPGDGRFVFDEQDPTRPNGFEVP